MRPLLLLMVFALFTASAQADFRGELRASYKDGTAELSSVSESPGLSSDDDFSGFEIGGELFLEPVDTSKGPLALADFLDRASSAAFEYGEFEFDDSGLETEFWTIDGRLVLNSLVIEAAFGNEDTGDNSDSDLLSGALGYYLLENTQVRLSYQESDADLLETERWALDVRHVQELSNGMTYELEALYGDVSGDFAFGSNDDGSDLLLGAAWYFNYAFGVGIDWGLLERDQSGDTDLLDIYASYFPTEKIELTLTYFSQENDDFGLESDGVEFEFLYRL